MHSPIEKIVAQQHDSLDKRVRGAEVREAKDAVLANIRPAMRNLTGTTILPDYALGDGESANIIVKAARDEDPYGRRGTRTIDIMTQFKNDDGQATEATPLYRVLRYIPDTDGMGTPPARYEIAVADSESESGYHTLAQVVRGQAPEWVSRHTFNSQTELSQAQVSGLVTEGLYIEPRSEHLLSEVNEILAMAVAQDQKQHVGETALAATS